MKYLTLDEIKRLYARLQNKRDICLIQLGLSTGCRVSEIVSIKNKMIEKDRIKVFDKKKDQYREVVIDSETYALIQDYLKTEWKSKPHVQHQLFYFSTRTANRILKKYCELAGIPEEKSHFHALRHTYVVQSLDAGVPLNHVCAQTGDSIKTVLEVYGQPSIDTRKAMIDEKGKFWKNIP